MPKKCILLIGVLLAAALVIAGFLTYTYWPFQAGDRPSLLYFRSST